MLRCNSRGGKSTRRMRCRYLHCMLQAEIAVLRFGLGAKPGDLAAAAGDPRAWLKAQIKGAVPLAVDTPLAPSAQIFEGWLAGREKRQRMKAAAAQASAAQASAPQTADAQLGNAIREAYQPHYRAQ